MFRMTLLIVTSERNVNQHDGAWGGETPKLGSWIELCWARTVADR